eukprot:Gregarina_sp_Poly_1__26@NODE_1005_length_5396_cov_91_149184_g326_i2_p2_GENE_NODE_1005_length_5396_cov_91_149184_g326_i2NODE_1005_length_5396_cov_91_149184_g326_i2_p2_ORF_typecomplete_len424_score41_06Abhydrolase_1/PF00561_20/2_4e14Hydrolase_4/PF12146_8/6e12Abhydrolase_6/PF12697_7/7_2e03Abhydrolase_6/PF12697_7/1_5e08Esterase/PF00756_20/0_00012Chlorophyllase2/PF12740_7/0_00059BAAT_C/PF08840_11/0_00094Abhydrolase_5/PF12695_7/0_0069Abhydrolase_5/PF12695_7/1_8e03Peptidase_S9/PF00326_21/0_0059Chloroph
MVIRSASISSSTLDSAVLVTQDESSPCELFPGNEVARQMEVDAQAAADLFPNAVRLWKQVLESPRVPNVSICTCRHFLRTYQTSRELSQSEYQTSRELAQDEYQTSRELAQDRIQPSCINAIEFAAPGLPVSIVSMHGMNTGVDNLIPIGKAIVPPLHRFVALTPRNYENSPWLLDNSSEAHLDDIARAVWEERRLPHRPLVGVLGHSLGGTRSMMLALKYPDLVDFLIILDMAPVSYDDLKMRLALKLWLATPLIIERAKDKPVTLAEAEKSIQVADPYVSESNRKFLLSLFARPNVQHRHEPDISMAKDQLFNLNYGNCVSEETLMDCFHFPMELLRPGEEIADDSAKPWKVKPFLKPCLFLRGDRSRRFMPPEAVAKVFDFFPLADLEVVNQAGHLLMLDNLSETQTLIYEWLQKVFRFA